MKKWRFFNEKARIIIWIQLQYCFGETYWKRDDGNGHETWIYLFKSLQCYFYTLKAKNIFSKYTEIKQYKLEINPYLMAHISWKYHIIIDVIKYTMQWNDNPIFFPCWIYSPIHSKCMTMRRSAFISFNFFGLFRFMNSFMR